MSGISIRIKILLFAAAILVCSASFVSAESVWEGSAAMGRYGEFPFTGYYGASNSFPQNTFVEVENIENGKRTRLIVVDRLSDSGLLMLLSNQAAEDLGIYQGDISRIKVRLISKGDSASNTGYDDMVYNPDPDFNPAAEFMINDDLAVIEPVTPASTEAETKTEPEPELVVVEPEAEPEPELVIVEPEAEPEPELVVVEPEAEPELVVVEPEAAPELELLSYGLNESTPVYEPEDSFDISILPEVVKKEDDKQYLAEVSDYYSPDVVETEVSDSNLPVPEIEVAEELITELVGEHLDIIDSMPEDVAVSNAYSDTPEIINNDEDEAVVVVSGLDEAYPLSAEGTELVAEALPALPGSGDRMPIDVADGYVSPEKEPVEDTVLSEVTETPTLADTSETGVSETEIIETAVPEYDENIEISLVPAEARPPEGIEEPETVIEEAPVIEAEPVIAAAENASNAEQAVTAPERIMMVSKLQNKKHYLQLGAYKEKKSAIRAAGKLDEVYPVTILTDNAKSGLRYKLLLGPLTVDESGVMLYNFRAGGYSDAFIRRIE